MYNQFTINIRALQRVVCTMLIALLVTAGLPMFESAASADQLSTRSIQMSDSSPSGGSITTGVGSGTGVTYRVSLTTVHQAGSIVIDFCTEDPILGDACTPPTNMGAATGVTGVSGTMGDSDWTLTAAAGQVKLHDDATGPHDAQAATQQIFDLTGITNPSTTGTFFARIYTYTNNTYGATAYVSPTSIGSYVDYGGVAISTVSVITITGRVQEQLTFCVTSANPTTWTGTTGTGAIANSCSADQVGANLPAVTLGHGSPTPVLDSNTVDRGTIYSQLSTNATHGAVINLRNSNTSCGGLSADNGTTCAIPAVGATASAIVAGTAAFGLFVSNSFHDAATAASTGTITPSLTYNDGTHQDETTPSLYYGMNNDTATPAAAVGGGQAAYSGAVNSTYGSTIASASAPVYRVENDYVFAATSALTTPAGIYTANLSMIATGTF